MAASSNSILTEAELTQLVSDVSNYDYIRLSWSDIQGAARGVTVPAERAKSFIRSGFSAPVCSALLGPSGACEKDLFLKIGEEFNKLDNCTFIPCRPGLYPLPWVHKSHRTAELLCEASSADASELPSLPRSVARKQLEKLKAMGFGLLSAFESEFYLLNCKTMEPLLGAMEVNYFSHNLMDDHVEWMYSLEKNLHEAGIQVRAMHPEFFSSQFELNFMPEKGLATFDNMYIYKQATRCILKLNDYAVTFMSKPQKETLGNGLHFNFSLWDDAGKNAFYDAEAPNKLSETAMHFLGGILKHLPGMTAICCPTVNCYRRLHGPAIPSYPNWGIDYRFVAMRAINENEKVTRFEHRLPSGASNPYLVAAVVLAAGIDGLVNKITPPPPGLHTDGEQLPKSLEHAIKKLKEDEVLCNALGEEFIKWFCFLKTEYELKSMKNHDMKKFIPEEVEKERMLYLQM